MNSPGKIMMIFIVYSFTHFLIKKKKKKKKKNKQSGNFN